MSESAPFTNRQTTGTPRPPRTEEIGAHTIRRDRFSAAVGPVDWKPPTVEEVAALLPQFQLLEFIGRGGMGAVYKARQVALNRLVAIKLLPSEVAAEENFAERFTREARTLAKLNHPHIVGIYDFGTTADGHSWFAMEYVDGAALHTLIEHRKLTPPQTLQIMADVCEGLACAHRHGVIHRDVKPSNVLVDSDGRAKIADFGIARIETPDQDGRTTGALFGTPSYMAPEQLEHREVDHRADLYAVGVMLYEALCFQLPRGHVDPPSTRVPCDARVDEIVSRAMQNDPTRRHQTAQEMHKALRGLCHQSETVDLKLKPKVPLTSAKGETEPAQPVSSGLTDLFVRQTMVRRWGTTAAVLVLLFAGLAIYGLTTLRDPRTAAKQSAAIIPAHPAPEPSAQKNRPTEPWKDLIAEEKAKGELPEGLYEVPGGYGTRTPPGKPGVYLMSPQLLHDQALRVTYIPAPEAADSGLQLILRSSPDFKELYRLHAYATDWQIVKRSRGGQAEILLSIPKTDEMKKPGPRTVEFRAEGERLSFYYNGALCGSAYDPTFSKGRPRVHCGEGVIFHNVEYLDISK